MTNEIDNTKISCNERRNRSMMGIPLFINQLKSTGKNGAHILYMFNEEDRYMNNVYHFIAEGIEQREKIVLVEEQEIFENIVTILLNNGYTKEDMKLLEFMSIQDFYFSEKGFNAEENFQKIEQLLERSIKKGLKLRTWGNVVADSSLISEIRNYESKVDRLLEGSDTISVCAYNAFVTPAFFQNELLKVHEYVMIEEELERSPFYHKKYRSFPQSEREKVNKLESEIRILRERNEELLIGNARHKEREEYLYEEKLNAEQANHAKTLFLSKMSHDLRTPLNTIQGYSQILLMESYPDLHQKIVKIYNASEQLLHLIEEILDFTAVDTGRVNIYLEEIHLKTFLEDCVGSFLETNTSTISIQLEDIPTDLYIEADSVRLNQIITNLIDNALKYNQANGTVQIFCEDGEEVKINTKDSGIGIGKEDLPHIYDPFYRSKSTLNKWKGTGIGLSIVSQLTKRMNGNYGVKSEEGKGSTFWVSFKKLNNLAQDEVHKNSKKESLVPSGHSIKVIYIEDNKDNVDVMKSMLHFMNTIDLKCALSGKDGIKQVFEQKPDIVLLDLALPDMNGFDVLRQIKSNSMTKDIPVIAISADAMEATIKKASEEGFHAYIKKPVHFEELRSVLQSTMIYKNSLKSVHT